MPVGPSNYSLMKFAKLIQLQIQTMKTFRQKNSALHESYESAFKDHKALAYADSNQCP